MKKNIVIALCVIGLTTNVLCADNFFKSMKKTYVRNSDTINLLLKSGFAIWGLTQQTTYGYVTGSLFAISVAFDAHENLKK